MAEFDVKRKLREEGFRHKRDIDRGATWSNGLVDVFVPKTFNTADGKAKLRALLEQVRDGAKRKAAEARREQVRAEAEMKSVQQRGVVIEISRGDVLYPAIELAKELISNGRNAEEIAHAFNVQGIRFGEGRQFDGFKWASKDVWDLCSKQGLWKAADMPVELKIVDSAPVIAAPPVVPVAQVPVAVPAAPGRKKYSKFSGEERIYVFGRIKAMVNMKWATRKIYDALNAEGLRQPNGKPFDSTYVSALRGNWKLKPHQMDQYEAIVSPRPRRQPEAPAAIIQPQQAIAPPVVTPAVSVPVPEVIAAPPVVTAKAEPVVDKAKVSVRQIFREELAAIRQPAAPTARVLSAAERLMSVILSDKDLTAEKKVQLLGAYLEG